MAVSTNIAKGSPAEIKELQQGLNLLKHTGANDQPLKPDGVWGKNTKAAVVKFQEANGLEADGIPGVATIEALVNSPSLSNEKPDTVVPPAPDSTGGLDQLPSVAAPTTAQGASKAPTTPTTKTTPTAQSAEVDPAVAERQKAIKAMQAKAAQKAKAQQSAQNRVVKTDPHGEEQAGGVGPKKPVAPQQPAQVKAPSPSIQSGTPQKKIKKDAPKAKVSTDNATIYSNPKTAANTPYNTKQEAMTVLGQIYNQYKAARSEGDKKTISGLLPRIATLSSRSAIIQRNNPGVKNLIIKLKGMVDNALSESYNNNYKAELDEKLYEWGLLDKLFGSDEAEAVKDAASAGAKAVGDKFATNVLPGEHLEAEIEVGQWGFAATQNGIYITDGPSKGSELKLTRKDYFPVFGTIPWSFVEKFAPPDTKYPNDYQEAFIELAKGKPEKQSVEKILANLPDELKQEAFKIRDNFVAVVTQSIESLQYKAIESADEAYTTLGQAVDSATALINKYNDTAEHADLVAAVEGYNKLTGAVQQYASQSNT